MKRITVTKESNSGRNEEFKDNETGILMTREEFVKKIELGEYPDYHIRDINGIKTPVSDPDLNECNNLDSDCKENKAYSIIINGEENIVNSKEISFDELVKLSNLGESDITTFTITFRRGHGNKPEGSLIEDEFVKIKDGMVFNVIATDKS